MLSFLFSLTNDALSTGRCCVQVFCKNLNNLQMRFFDRLMPIATVSGGAVYTMPQDIVTNHLVIRGSFQVRALERRLLSCQSILYVVAPLLSLRRIKHGLCTNVPSSMCSGERESLFFWRNVLS